MKNNLRFRAQAALEYLTTYGWALLIIFIVIAALMVIAPVSTPPTCRFDQIGFSCPVPSIDTSGKLFMRIANSNNNDVVISALACTDDKASTPPIAAQWTPFATTPIEISRQGEVDISNRVVCKRGGAATTFVQAEDFTGRVWIKYKNKEDPSTYPDRMASAVIATKIA